VAALTTGFSIPDTVIRPGVVLILLVFTVLGILLWNAFFGAVASTVDDPNTSTRSGLLMLPMVPVALTFVIVRDPDGPVARALAVVPGTSVPAMPVRLVLTDPAPLEVVASLLLLVGAILLVRRVAARVFEVGMLLYGKEPAWAEIARWARSRPADS
jgi:ABC-2 type transport system permease protein